MAALDVKSWKDKELTFRTFGCVYHRARKVKKKKSKEVEGPVDGAFGDNKESDDV